MKLSEKTLSVLKNFAVVNQGLVFNAGEPVFTKTVSNSMLARCDFEEEFNTDFAIYDLTKFLQVYSLFKEPDLFFKDKYILMENPGVTVKYFYSEPDVVKFPLDDDIATMLAASDGLKPSFILPSGDFIQIQKAASIMNLDIVTFLSIDGKITATLGSSDGETNNQYVIELGESSEDFEASFFVENFRIIPASYEASLALESGFLMLYSESLNTTYWIATT